MAYTAPQIKDRVAVGDTKYQMQQLADGRIVLTPAPDEVIEAGTDINKALLQPMADMLEVLNPYARYWWRRRKVTWTEKREYGYPYTTSYISGGSTRHIIAAFIGSWWYNQNDGSGDKESEVTSKQIKAYSSITINPTTGAVSLSGSVTTINFTNTSNKSTVAQQLRGKYISADTIIGINSAHYKICYVNNAGIVNASIPTYGLDSTHYNSYTGLDEAESSEGYDGWASVTSERTVGSWESISSDTDDAYPHSGDSGGYEYEYIGFLSEEVLRLSNANRASSSSNAANAMILSTTAATPTGNGAILGVYS